MNPNFRITIRKTEFYASISFYGELTENAEKLIFRKVEIEGLFLDDHKAVVINLKEINYINDSGISCLSRIIRMAERRGIPIFSCGASAPYDKIFRLLGLTKRMMMYPDENAIMHRLHGMKPSFTTENKLNC